MENGEVVWNGELHLSVTLLPKYIGQSRKCQRRCNREMRGLNIAFLLCQIIFHGLL